jgi:hypothetical protein
MALPASPMGKLKLVSQVVAILALLFAREQGRELWLIGQGALWIADDHGHRLGRGLFEARQPGPRGMRPLARIRAITGAGPRGRCWHRPKPSPQRSALRRSRFDLRQPFLGVLQVVAHRKFADELLVVRRAASAGLFIFISVSPR